MKKVNICTLAIVGTLATVNVNAAVDIEQIQNNVLRRIINQAQHSIVMGDNKTIQDWEQSWPQWSQCHNPNGC